MNLRESISRWNIVKHTKLWFTISLIIILIGIGALLFNQFTVKSPLILGIDFKGGTVIELYLESKPDLGKVNTVLSGLGIKGAIVQEAQGNKIIIKTTAEMISPELVSQIETNISDNVAKVTEKSITSIAPVIGRELMKNGAIALGLALLFILLYISLRFQFKFALATVIALFHDVAITLGMLALFRVELNAPFIGAILAIITYSVEDSVVVLDRIREKLKYKGKQSFKDLVNDSIKEVWIRSMNTSLTTFFSSLALVIFGGATLRSFSMTLLFGLISGTYSSIYIASPLLVLWHKEPEREGRFVRVEEAVKTEPQLNTVASESESKEEISKKPSKKKSKRNKRRY